MHNTLIFLCIFIYFESYAKSFCIIENLKKYDIKKINCKNKDFVFGYLNFNSKNKNLDYFEDKRKNLKVVKKYHKNINKFIDDLCYIDDYLKTKEIINFDKKKKIFKVVLVISCRMKNE